jgi:hypothetical protein
LTGKTVAQEKSVGRSHNLEPDAVGIAGSRGDLPGSERVIQDGIEADHEKRFFVPTGKGDIAGDER